MVEKNPEPLAAVPEEEPIKTTPKPEASVVIEAPEKHLDDMRNEVVDALKVNSEEAKSRIDSPPVNETDAANQIKAKQNIDAIVQDGMKTLEERYAEIKSNISPPKTITPRLITPKPAQPEKVEQEKPVMKVFPNGEVIIPPGSPEYEQLRNLPRAEAPKTEDEPAKKGIENVRVTPGTPEHEEVLEFRKKLQVDELARKNAELEKENAELKAKLEEKEKAPEADDTRIMSEDELRELKEKYEREHPEPAGQAEEAAKNVIEQIASDEKSHLELKLISDGHNIARFWHSVWAKHDKDTLAKREVWVEKLENDLARFADKSWFHTMLTPVHPKRILLAYCRAGREYSTQSLIYHEAERKRHEEARAGYIDVVASSLDAARKSSEGRKAEYEKYISEMDKYIAGLYEEHKDITMHYGSMPDTPEKRQTFAEQQAILKEINDAVAAKSKAQKMANLHGASADKIQSEQNAYLDMKVLVTQPDTSHKPRRRAKTGTPPKRTTEEKAA